MKANQEGNASDTAEWKKDSDEAIKKRIAAGREFQGQHDRGSRTESLWEGLSEGGFSEVFGGF